MKLFRPVRPPHAFVLTRERLVYVRKDRAEKPAGPLGAPEPFTVLARPLPAGTFTSGLGGVPVATGGLARAVAAIAAEAGKKIPGASLVVPDDFIRVATVDVPDADKSPRETDDVVAWKLGKAFGEPAPPLRFSWQAAGPGAQGTRVLAVGAPEEAAASWEGAFSSCGIRIGALETASCALTFLAKKTLGGEGFFVWADGESATTVFFQKGTLRFMRTKATSDPEEALQEIRLAASFVAADLAKKGEAPALDVDSGCAAGPAGSPIVERFRAFRAERGGRDALTLNRATLLGEPAAPRARVDDPAVLVGLAAMAGD